MYYELIKMLIEYERKNHPEQYDATKTVGKIEGYQVWMKFKSAKVGTAYNLQIFIYIHRFKSLIQIWTGGSNSLSLVPAQCPNLMNLGHVPQNRF